MRVKCKKDNTEFDAAPRPYPSRLYQPKDFNLEGDMILDCPTCGRGYFLYNGGPLTEGLEGWHSDRPLTILLGVVK